MGVHWTDSKPDKATRQTIREAFWDHWKVRPKEALAVKTMRELLDLVIEVASARDERFANFPTARRNKNNAFSKPIAVGGFLKGKFRGVLLFLLRC